MIYAPHCALRGIVLTGLALVVTCFAALGAPLAASAAGSYHPAACDDYIRSTWVDNNPCWIGQTYVNDGVSVLGMQYILSDKGYNPGTPDCLFGPLTDNATIRFQTAFSLTRDGIIGPNTLLRLKGELAYSGISNSNGSYYNVGIDGLRFFWEPGLGDYWFVKAHDGEYVAMGGVGGNVAWCGSTY